MRRDIKEADREALAALKNKTDRFISDVFDWVMTVNQPDLLGHLYDFKHNIDTALKGGDDHA